MNRILSDVPEILSHKQISGPWDHAFMLSIVFYKKIFRLFICSPVERRASVVSSA